MSASIAAAAAEAILKRSGLTATELAAGLTSQVWLVDDGIQDWVVRLPQPDSGRLPSYESEQLIGSLLGTEGHPVAEWKVVRVDAIYCSVARRLQGTPISYQAPWSARFASHLARLLRDLHTIRCVGYGPIRNTSTAIVGTATSNEDGIQARWSRAQIWPFDESTLDEHPVNQYAPDVAEAFNENATEIRSAASGPIGLVHSDLHREHLLVAPSGDLAAVLDFGDAFVGSITWDFALLHWYYGARNTQKVGNEYGKAGPDLARRGQILARAVGLYKLAKNRGDSRTVERLRALQSSS